MREYPKRIRMIMLNEFGRLGRTPLSSDKGRLYLQVDPEDTDRIEELEAALRVAHSILRAISVVMKNECPTIASDTKHCSQNIEDLLEKKDE